MNQEAKEHMIETYYAAHQAELVGYVKRCLQGAANAEDIVQDVFLRLLVSDRMITSVTLHSLVYTMARNLIYDFWRHHRTVLEYEHRLKTDGSYGGMDVQTIYDAREMVEWMERGMNRLTVVQRDIYRMNTIEGMKVSEISEQMGVNYKSVENKLGTARKEMRKYMRRLLA